LYDDNTYGGLVEVGGTYGRHTLRGAGHLKKDEHRDNNSGEPPKEFDGRIVSVGFEDTVVLSSRLSLVGGVSGDRQTTTRARDFQKSQVIDLLEECRADDGSCGTASGFNAQAGLFYGIPTGQLRLTVSRKTRMPSLKDRYSYKFGTAIPNPDLRSEHNLGMEGGYQGTLGAKTSFGASVFYSRIDNLIQRFFLQPNLSQSRNIGRASHGGLELDVRTRLLPLVDAAANYTFLERNNLSDPDLPLIDTPRHKARVSMAATVIPSLQLVAGLDYEAARKTQNDSGAFLDVPSFATLDVKASLKVRRQLDLELGMFNAFDANYWVSEGFPERGRTVISTVRWRF
jgi:iron complex outermembrane receptor protein